MEGGALAVRRERLVPVAVAVGEVHRLVGAGVLDDVSDVGHVVQPVGVGGAHAGAAMRHVRVTLAGDRPRGGVDELTGVGHPHRPLDAMDVVRVGARDPDGLGVHVLTGELLDDDLDAGARGVRRLLAGRDE